MSPSLLEATEIRKEYDGILALADFTCLLREREILGIVGPNGAGKTTFFNVLTGFVSPERGKATFRGRDLIGLPPHAIAQAGIARTFQTLRLARGLSVEDNVLLCFPEQGGERLMKALLQPRACGRQEAKNRDVTGAMLEEVGLYNEKNGHAEALSYGQQKLLSILCCLATGADLLLLDEPVAGIAPAMTERVLRLVRDLPKKGKSVIIIEHDLDSVTRVCHRVIFMDAGKKISEGTPEEVWSDSAVFDAYLK